MALNLSAFQKNIQPKKKTNLNLSAFGITQEKTQQPAQPQSIWRNIPTATDWRKTLPMSIAKPQEQPKQNLLQSAVSGIENIGKGVSEFKSSFGEGWNRGVLSTGSVIERVASLGARNVGLQDISQKLDTLAEKDKELATYGIDVVDTRKFTEKIKDPNFIAKGIGQNLPNMLVAMGAAAPAAIAGAPTAVVGGIGFLTSGMLEGGFAYEDALSMGVDKKKAEKIAGVVGVINGLLETLPITKLLTRSKAGKDIKRSLIREITKRTVAQASMEAGTESIQEIVSNSLATIYDKNRDILSGVPESALFGGIMGGGMSAAIDVAGRVKNVGLTIEDVSGQELEAEARKYKTAEEFVKAQFSKPPEYGMSHRPSWDGMPPAHNLLEGKALPRDVYTHPDLSIANGAIRRGEKAANESWQALQKIKGKPNAKIIVYRAGAKNELNTGDWITLSKEYAKQSIEGTEKVHSFKVIAKDILFAGDDINEFGYYPKSQLTDIWNKANKKTAKGGLPELGKADDLIWARGTRAAGIQNAGLKNYNLATKALEKAGELPSEIKSDKITKDFIKNYYETKKPPVVGDVFINGKGEKIEITKIKDNVVDYFLKGKKKGISGSIYADNKFLKPKEIKPATSGLPALPKLPTKKDLSLKQTTPAIKKPQELTTQPTPRGEATPIEAKAPRTKSTLNTPAEAISNSESQILDYAGQKVDVSLDNIIDQMPTPVKRKVNAVDWLIRTPEKVLRKIGLGKEMDNLRKGYDAYLKELPKNIDKITEWTKQVPTKENNQNIFLYLDGQDVKLNPTELKVAGEIKTWLSEWADRLKLPKDNRITHYITHLFDEQLIKKEFDEDLAKIISQKIPGSVYDPFLIKRLGAKGYKVDTWAALDAYVKRGTRKVNLDPALEKIDEIAPSLEQSQWDYLKEYIDRVNLRPTKIDTSIDNTIKSVVGYKFGQRPTAMISRVMRQAGYRGGLWFNVSSTLRNLSQGINTYAVLGEKYTALGYAKLFSKANRQEIIDQGVLNAGFIDDRILSATQKLWQKADNVGFAMFQAVEGINRGSAYLGAKAKALSMGKNEAQAIEYGKKIARETQFTFGSIDTPLAFSNDIVKTLMQFQTYTTKQVEFLSELAKDRNFGALARYTAAGLLYVATIGQAFGMDWKELIPAWRLPAPPAGKFLATTAGAILNAPDKYGNQRDFPKKLKDIAATAWGIVPGGSQAKKTIQGYQSIQDGGSYDAAGRLQFKQDQSTAGQLQSLLFGKYAGQNAQNYFDKKGTKTKESGLPALPKLPKLPTLPKLPQL